jgi:hypothetical protein
MPQMRQNSKLIARFIVIVIILLSLVSNISAQTHHFPALDSNNSSTGQFGPFTGLNQFSLGLQSGPLTFSQLSPSGPNGTATYCSNCQQTSVCVGGGGGAWAVYIAGVWTCATGTGATTTTLNVSQTIGQLAPTPACPFVLTSTAFPVSSAITFLSTLGCTNTGVIYMMVNEDWPQGGGPFGSTGWTGLLYIPNASTSNQYCGQTASISGVWNCITTEGPIVWPGRLQVRGTGASGSTQMSQGSVITYGKTFPPPLGMPAFSSRPTCVSGGGSLSTAPSVTVALVRNGLGGTNTPLTSMYGIGTLPFTANAPSTCQAGGASVQLSITSLAPQSPTSIVCNGTICTVTFATQAACNEVTGNKVLFAGTGSALDGQTLTVNSPGCQDTSFTGLTGVGSGTSETLTSGSTFDSNFFNNGMVYVENCNPQTFNTRGQYAVIASGGGTSSITFTSTSLNGATAATGCNAVVNGTSFTANSSLSLTTSGGTVTNSRCGECTGSNDPTYGAYDVAVFMSPAEVAINSTSVSGGTITVNVTSGDCVFLRKWTQVIFHGTGGSLMENQVGTVTNTCANLAATSFKVKPNAITLSSLTVSTGYVSQWPYGPGTEIQLQAAQLTCPKPSHIDPNACGLFADGSSGNIVITGYSSLLGVTNGIASPLADLSNPLIVMKRGVTNGFDSNFRDLSLEGSPNRNNPTPQGNPELNNPAVALWNPICQEECGVKEVNVNGTRFTPKARMPITTILISGRARGLR